MSGQSRIIPVGAEPASLVPMAVPVGGDVLTVGRTEPPSKRSGGRQGRAVRRRFGLLNAFIDLALPRLRRSEIAAWLSLYRHAQPDGTVTASVADLARRAGCCERAMRTALERLRTFGALERIKRGTLAGGPSVWRLKAPHAGLP